MTPVNCSAPTSAGLREAGLPQYQLTGCYWAIAFSLKIPVIAFGLGRDHHILDNLSHHAVRQDWSDVGPSNNS